MAETGRSKTIVKVDHFGPSWLKKSKHWGHVRRTLVGQKERKVGPKLSVLVLFILVIAFAGCVPAEQSSEGAGVFPPSSIETIVFADYNWASAQIQNRIAQYIVEKGYGVPTDVVFGATLPLFQGLRRGDIQVSLEIWLPNQIEAWYEAEANGEVIEVGKSLGNDWQSAFVIPAYLQEQYPDLDSVEDLKEERFKALFATPETGGKGAAGVVCDRVGV